MALENVFMWEVQSVLKQTLTTCKVPVHTRWPRVRIISKTFSVDIYDGLGFRSDNI